MPTNASVYCVTASSLHVRREPTPESASLGFLRKGDRVKVLDTSGDGQWYFVEVAKGKRGWSNYKFLVAEEVLELPEAEKGEFPWMPIARGELGVAEKAGSTSHPRVIEYLNSTDLDNASASTDETPWCSAFVNWCVENAGLEGTNSAWARSWLSWGKKTSSPKEGVIAVFTRGVSSGHVAFFLKDLGDSILVLGGNQSDRVCEAKYSKDRLLGYRIPG